MKTSMVVGVLAAVAGVGAAAWVLSRPAVPAAPAAKLGCQPTPIQLDAWGKLNNVLIVVSGTGEKLGAHVEGATLVQFDTVTGVLKQGANVLGRMTSQLCDYVRSPAGSPFNAAAISRYQFPTAPMKPPFNPQGGSHPHQ